MKNQTVSRPKARSVNLKAFRFYINCSRAGIWGNPYRIEPDGSRSEVIAKHKAHIRHRIPAGNLSM